jgi:hypothetical protein
MIACAYYSRKVSQQLLLETQIVMKCHKGSQARTDSWNKRTKL